MHVKPCNFLVVNLPLNLPRRKWYTALLNLSLFLIYSTVIIVCGSGKFYFDVTTAILYGFGAKIGAAICNSSCNVLVIRVFLNRIFDHLFVATDGTLGF